MARDPADEWLDQRVGAQGNAAEEALHQESRFESLCEHLFTADPAIVKSYDVADQRVDVRLKNEDPDMATVRRVPVLGVTKHAGMVYPLKTIDADGTENADVGLLLYPRTDSRNSYLSRGHTPPPLLSGACHKGLGPVFIPLLHLRDEGSPDLQASGRVDRFDAGDAAWFANGAGIIIDDDGVAALVQPGATVDANPDPNTDVFTRVMPTVFHAHDDAGGQELTSSFQGITLDTLDVEDVAYTFSAGDAAVEVAERGSYEIHFQATAELTSNATGRSESEFAIQVDDGSGWTTVGGGRALLVHATTDARGTNGSAKVAQNLDAGDKVRVAGKQTAGSDTVKTFPDAVALTIRRIRG